MYFVDPEHLHSIMNGFQSSMLLLQQYLQAGLVYRIEAFYFCEQKELSKTLWFSAILGLFSISQWLAQFQVFQTILLISICAFPNRILFPSFIFNPLFLTAILQRCYLPISFCQFAIKKCPPTRQILRKTSQLDGMPRLLLFQMNRSSCVSLFFIILPGDLMIIFGQNLIFLLSEQSNMSQHSCLSHVSYQNQMQLILSVQQCCNKQLIER